MQIVNNLDQGSFSTVVRTKKDCRSSALVVFAQKAVLSALCLSAILDSTGKTDIGKRK